MNEMNIEKISMKNTKENKRMNNMGTLHILQRYLLYTGIIFSYSIGNSIKIYTVKSNGVLGK